MSERVCCYPAFHRLPLQKRQPPATTINHDFAMKAGILSAWAVLFIMMCGPGTAWAQPVTDGVGNVGIGTFAPHGSSILETSSTSKGILLPRLTTPQRDAIMRPAHALLIYNTDDSTFQYNIGDEFRPLWSRIVVVDNSGVLRAPLRPGAIWYGGADSLATELAPGGPGDVLVMNSAGSGPEWQSLGSLDYWRLGGNSALPSNILGTLDTTDIDIRTDSINRMTIDGTTGDVAISSSLSLTGSNTPLNVNGDPGIAGELLQSGGAGATAEWSSDLNVNSIEVDSITVNEYANITTNVFTTDSTVFNTNTVFNDTAVFNEYTNINGVEFFTDSTVNFWNQVTISVDSTVVNNTFVSNDSAFFGGPINFGDTVIFNTLPSLPLNENALYVGSSSDVAEELASTNTEGAVLQQNASGMPIWDNNLNVNSIEVDSITVNEYANITTNVFTTDSTVFNTNTVFNDTAVFNEYTNINGVEFFTDSTVNFWNQVTISVDSTVVNNTFVSNDSAFFGGPINFGDTVIFNTLPSLPLSENALYVGNSSDVAEELPSGNDGDVLTINGTSPVWTPNPGGLLPGGTVAHSTLRWNGTDWVENTNLRSDVAGNAIVEGDLTVNGTSVNLPAGSVDNSELANSSINVNYGAGASGSASVALGGTLTINNTGVTSLTGTANQVNVSSSTGSVTLSTPQDIHDDAVPTFDGLTLDNLSGSSASTEVVVSNGGVLETRDAGTLSGTVGVVSDGDIAGRRHDGQPAWHRSEQSKQLDGYADVFEM